MKPKKHVWFGSIKKCCLNSNWAGMPSELKINNLIRHRFVHLKNLFDEMQFLIDKSENL